MSRHQRCYYDLDLFTVFSQTAKTTKPECEDELTEDEESEVNDVEESSNDADLKLANHRFFKRSDSTLVLGL